MDRLRLLRLPTLACLCLMTLSGCQGGEPKPSGTSGSPATRSASTSVAVPAGTTGAGTFDRAISSVGLNAAVWNGGTLAQLVAGVPAAGGITATEFIGGKPVVLVPNAPDYVNEAYSKAHPNGMIPPGTIMIVAKR